MVGLVGENENTANSAGLELGLRLSLAISRKTNSPAHYNKQMSFIEKMSGRELNHASGLYINCIGRIYVEMMDMKN